MLIFQGMQQYSIPAVMCALAKYEFQSGKSLKCF